MCRKLICLFSFILVLALAGFVQAEILLNPDFEAGLDSWKTWGSGSGSGAGGYFWSSAYGATAMEDGTAQSGNTYIEVGFSPPDVPWWGYCYAFQEHPVTEGKTYQMSTWLRDADADGAPSLIAGGGTIVWEWRVTAPIGGPDTGDRGDLLDVDGDGVGGNSDKIHYVFDLTEQWTYFSATEVAPPGAKGLTVIFGTPTAFVNVDIDNASFVELVTIPVPNAGFEDPVLAEDDWTWLDVPGWTWVGGEGPGIWHVTSADFDPVVAPEGQNVLYTENAVGDAGGVAQVLTDTFAANMDYTLTVEVGNSNYYYNAGYSVQLLAGGVVIAEDNDTLWPEYYKWATSTVEYTYDPADAALVGQPLEIRLLNLALDKDSPPAGEVVGVEFDNVTLSYVELVAKAAFGEDPIIIEVAASSDDVEESVVDGSMYLNSSDIEIMYDNNPADPLDEQVIGLRFTNVQVPKGSIIGKAFVRLDADDVDDAEHVGNAYVIIEGQLDPNAPTFEDTPNNITGRPRTAAQVQWTSEPWPADGGDHQKAWTADISSIIQEIVDQDGWAAGNALVLILSQDPATPSVGHRECESWDEGSGGNTGQPATLFIDIGAAPAPDEIAREAESADVLGARWRLVVDPAASGGVRIGSENGDGDDNDTAPGADWVAAYNFDATGGTYKVMLRAQEAGSDSFWVRILGATSINHEDPDQPGTGWTRFNEINADGWAWDEVHSNDHNNDAVYWTLPAGPHTIEIAKREDGTYLDGFIITNDLTLEQGKLSDVINPLAMAILPSPADGAGDVRIGSTLGWHPAVTAATHDVSFGTTSPPPLIGSQAAASFYPGLLQPATTYYWQVDEVQADGTTTIGDVWSFTAGFTNFALDIRIATSMDDVEERLQPDRNGDLDTGSSDFEMPYEDFDPLGDLQRAAMRFVNVGIPSGMQILESYIEFRVDAEAPRDNGTESASLIIDAQLTGDAEPFVDEPFNVSNRTFTETVVPWTSIEPWPTGGETKRTPDISVLVQELVNLPDWASGNAMVFTIQDDPCNPSEGIRATENSNGSFAPLLHIGSIVEAATGPSPADGAEGVPITGTIISWWPGFGAVSHNGYMGTSSPPSFIGNTPEITFDPGVLAPSTTYYWQLNAVDADGTTHTGAIWSFTTEPGEALQPDPADMAGGVALDATLSWSPGITAATHDVYFGTSSPPALIGNQAETTFDPGPLEFGTTYYWQVDAVEADGTTTYTGDIWSFSTRLDIPITDPSLLGWWTFDGVAGNTVVDYSGHNRYGTLVGDISFETDPIMGQVLSLPGGSNQFVKIGEVGISGTDQRTIACWAKADHTSIPDWTLIFGFTTEGGGNDSHFNIGSLGGPGGVGAHVWGWEETIFSDDEALDWRHYAMTYDGTTIAYYGDGVLMDTDPGKSNDRALVHADNVHIGSRITQDSSFPGKVDDARIYNIVLSEAEIRVIAGLLGAWSPDPADGATEVAKTATLSWAPGPTAVSHDVYFSTDQQAVIDGTALIGNQAETSYSPSLAKGTTYYWRVDEVEADGTTKHTGDVWSFTVTTLGR